MDLAQYPCSVIIIGLGDEDFEDMHELDGDKKRLTDDDGKEACRDMV